MVSAVRNQECSLKKPRVCWFTSDYCHKQPHWPDAHTCPFKMMLLNAWSYFTCSGSLCLCVDVAWPFLTLPMIALSHSSLSLVETVGSPSSLLKAFLHWCKCFLHWKKKPTVATRCYVFNVCAQRVLECMSSRAIKVFSSEFPLHIWGMFKSKCLLKQRQFRSVINKLEPKCSLSFHKRCSDHRAELSNFLHKGNRNPSDILFVSLNQLQYQHM